MPGIQVSINNAPTENHPSAKATILTIKTISLYFEIGGFLLELTLFSFPPCSHNQ